MRMGTTRVMIIITIVLHILDTFDPISIIKLVHGSRAASGGKGAPAASRGAALVGAG